MFNLGEMKCEVCGAPATQYAQDVRRIANDRTRWYEYDRYGRVRAGCAEHPVESRTFAENGVEVQHD